MFGASIAPHLDITLHVNEGTKATCYNVRSGPSASASIVGCAPFGSRATLDGGVAYESPASSDFLPLWWHIQNQGWINGVAICSADPCVGD